MAGETWNYEGIKDITKDIYTDGEKFYLIANEAEIPSIQGRINSGEVLIELTNETIDQIKKLEQTLQPTTHPFGEWGREPLPFP